MGRGVPAMILTLFALGALMAVAIAVVVHAAGLAPGDPALDKMSWEYFIKAVALPLNTSGGTGFMVAMLVLSFTSMFVGGTFIGLIGSGVISRLQELRKGRSFVVEKDHTVILGWSNQIFAIIGELVVANRSRSRAAIVILAEKGKVEMEDAIRAKIPHLGRTRIVCRTGSPIDMTDIALVNPAGARSFIILSPGGDDPDAQVIKSVLALTNNPDRKSERYHIVAELLHQRNVDVVKMIAPTEVRPVLVDDLIARITVQTCRQAGLSAVYNELLDFEGQEIYVHPEPALVGKTFREALFAYQCASPMGLCKKDGTTVFRPAMDTRIDPGDKLVVIAEDDASIKVGGSSNVELAALREARPPALEPERTLVLGWNRRARVIVSELDRYVAPGSALTVVTDDGAAEAELRAHAFTNMKTEIRIGDTTDRVLLDSLDVGTYHQVVTLSSDKLGAQAADARTLVALLHLRDIARKSGHAFSIVSEMLDVRNRELAEVARADDFIVSDRLVSLMLSQLSESRDLNLADLFDADGSELYLKPAADYVELGKPVTFYTVVEAAARRGEIAVGIREAAAATDRTKAYGVTVNPHKTKPFTYRDGDTILVLADT
jgi:voltage-gated potassium channel Kch